VTGAKESGKNVFAISTGSKDSIGVDIFDAKIATVITKMSMTRDFI